MTLTELQQKLRERIRSAAKEIFGVAVQQLAVEAPPRPELGCRRDPGRDRQTPAKPGDVGRVRSFEPQLTPERLELLLDDRIERELDEPILEGASEASTMSPWQVVVAIRPPMISLRRGTRSIRKKRQIAEPITAITPGAMFAISAALWLKPATTSSWLP